MNASDENKPEIQESSFSQAGSFPAPRPSLPTQESRYTKEDYRTALRILVGTALEGNDELRRQIKDLRRDVDKRDLASDPSYRDLDTKGGSQLTYSMIGLLFKTPDFLGKGITLAGRLTSRATGVVSRFTKPITKSRLLRPAHRSYQSLVDRGEYEMRSLEKIGRSEARSSRYLVNQPETDELLEEFLGFIVEKAKLRELIAEQGAAAATDVSTEVRQRSAAVDSSIDKIVDNILRRQKQKTPPIN